MRGADDTTILERAVAEFRVLISQDKDFGELAFKSGLPTQCGIILFRLTGNDPQTDLARMITAINGRDDWSGMFSVVENHRIRMRPLPSAPIS